MSQVSCIQRGQGATCPQWTSTLRLMSGFSETLAIHMPVTKTTATPARVLERMCHALGPARVFSTALVYESVQTVRILF